MTTLLDITSGANPAGLYYVHQDTKTAANWSGGIYVDLGYVEDGMFHAVDVINIGHNDGRSGHGHDYTSASLAVIVDEHMADALRPECDGAGTGIGPDGYYQCPGCNLCD